MPTAARVVGAPGGELAAQWRLAVPLAAQQVGLQLMGAVDTALLGHYSSTALAGASVGNGLVFALTCTAMGVVLGLDAVVPRALGAGDRDGADRALIVGLRLAMIIGIPTMLLVLASRWVLPLFSVEPAVATEAHAYILGRAFGVLPFLLSVAMRSYLAAHGKTRALLVAMIGGNLVNFAGDYVLIFGDAGLIRLGLPALGVPELGSFGAAFATALVQLATMIIYALAIARLRRGQGRTSLRRAVRAGAPGATGGELRLLTRRIVHHGVPIGLHLLAEVGVFATAGVLAAHFGTSQSAAHSVAITLASFTFSAAVGVGSATAVRIGLALGAAGPDALATARRRGLIGVTLGIAIMAAGALAFLLFPAQLAGIFTDRPEVLATAAPLLFIAAFFQLSDGIQAVAAGALRGAGDTRSTMWANLLGHYGIGLPISLALGFGADLGVRGVWWGLSAGLVVTAVILVRRFLRITMPGAPPRSSTKADL